MILPRPLLAILLAAGIAVPALAQQGGDVVPYERDMTRLAEILGALHYLRPLCRYSDGQVWKDKMAELMDAEGGPADRKERLAGAFNAGYRGFQQSYRACTPAAETAIRRYLEEGAKLTSDLGLRYGN